MTIKKAAAKQSLSKQPRTVAEVQEQHKKEIAKLKELHLQDTEALSQRTEDLENMLNHNANVVDQINSNFRSYKDGVRDALQAIHHAPKAPFENGLKIMGSTFHSGLTIKA